MEEKSKEQICREIEEFKTTHGGNYPEYYIGVTNNLTRRLIENNDVDEHVRSGILDENSPTYQANAGTREIAVEIEQFFQREKKMKEYNPRAKGVEGSKYIYCFKINATDELIVEDMEESETKSYIRKTLREFLDEKDSEKQGD